MALNTTQRFIATPATKRATVSTANTNIDGSGTIADLWSATGDVDRITSVSFKASGTTTAGQITLYHYSSTYKPIKGSVVVTANTPSSTNPSWEGTWTPDDPNGFFLASGEKLGASTYNAETFYAETTGGAY